jgi:hypothetical protein
LHLTVSTKPRKGHSFGWKADLEKSGDAVRLAAPTCPNPPIASRQCLWGDAKTAEHDASEAGRGRNQST